MATVHTGLASCTLPVVNPGEILGVYGQGRFVKGVKITQDLAATSATHTDVSGFPGVSRLKNKTGLSPFCQHVQRFFLVNGAAKSVFLVKIGSAAKGQAHLPRAIEASYSLNSRLSILNSTPVSVAGNPAGSLSRCSANCL